VSEKFFSCNGLGCSPFQIVSGLTHSYSKVPDWFRFADRGVILTHQGRYAIYLICRFLNIGAGDEVLVPAYNCGAEVDPFVWAGAKVVFYKVDRRAAIDTEDILRRVTPSTKLVYITHYFGWPQEIGELAERCKRKGLFLVEDCAQALFSKGPKNTIARLGDASVFSFVKSLSVPDGGALAMRTGETWQEVPPFDPPPYHNTVLNSLHLFKKWFLHTNKFWQHHEFTRKLLNRSWLKKPTDEDREIEREMPVSNYFDERKVNWSISSSANSILCRTNPERIVVTRRRNYQHLQAALHDIPSIQLLFDNLPDGVCPLSFPIFVHDRTFWCDELENRGILVGGWPSYHRGFNWEEFPETRHLKNDLLTLPVHQGLSVDHIEYIAECVKTIAEKNVNSNSR
jgi:perosamine synthetase